MAKTNDIDKHIKITRMTPTVNIGDDGLMIRQTNVEFTVKGQGPFSVQMPTIDLDAKELNRMMRAFATEVVKVLDLEV